MVESPKNITSYILGFPEDVQIILKAIRVTITEAAPEAQESIAYGMPAFKLKGKPLVYFAAYKKHIGFYATATGHAQFEEELSGYKQGKGSVQFPLAEPMPLELIMKIVKFRAQENLAHNSGEK